MVRRTSGGRSGGSRKRSRARQVVVAAVRCVTAGQRRCGCNWDSSPRARGSVGQVERRRSRVIMSVILRFELLLNVILVMSGRGRSQNRVISTARVVVMVVMVLVGRRHEPDLPRGGRCSVGGATDDRAGRRRRRTAPRTAALHRFRQLPIKSGKVGADGELGSGAGILGARHGRVLMVAVNELMMPMVMMVVMVVMIVKSGRGSHTPRRIHELAVEAPTQPALIRFSHGRQSGKFAPHRVVPEGPLDDPSRVIRPGMPAIFALQQLNLLIQQILRQFVSIKKEREKKVPLENNVAGYNKFRTIWVCPTSPPLSLFFYFSVFFS